MLSQLNRSQPVDSMEDGAPGVSSSVSLVARKFTAPVTGSLIGVSANGSPLVDFPGNPTRVPLNARSCVELADRDIGKEIVLLFEDGDGTRPIVAGVVRTPVAAPINEAVLKTAAPLEDSTVVVDGKTVALCAKESLTLRCGNASITLTRDGKVLIRGVYLQSRSSGVNRIQGGSVQVN
jgi:hypothetical protein